MKFKMSTNIAVRTVQFSEAVNFYSKVLGFPNRSKNAELADLDADPLTIFIDDDREFVGPILELFVDDLESARDYLIENGLRPFCFKELPCPLSLLLLVFGNIP